MAEAACDNAVHLVDSHAHLDFPGLTDRLDEVFKNAAAVGVRDILSIGTTPASWDVIVPLAESRLKSKKGPRVFATVGVHPCDCAEVKAHTLADTLSERTASPAVVGLGETGLDFFHQPFDRAHQEACLAAHMQVGIAHNLPLVIHTREAEEATLQVLAPAMQRGLRVVIHCFSGSAGFAEACLAMGCYISFSGIVTFKKAEALREVVRLVPLDRLLVETDAPYLAPDPYRGKTNEPAFVRHTAEKIAAVKGIALDEVAAATTHNFFRLFTKAAPHAGITL